jgi:hypothetical protein
MRDATSGADFFKALMPAPFFPAGIAFFMTSLSFSVWLLTRDVACQQAVPVCSSDVPYYVFRSLSFPR